MSKQYVQRPVLVIGANGQLGREIKSIVSKENIDKKQIFYFTEKNMLDITKESDIHEFIIRHKIGIIINCAAYTAVDKAESEPESANLINHVAVKRLACISKDENIRLIHVSTEYVFDGKSYRPYTEDDITNPVNIYGETKLKGELSIQNVHPDDSVIVRTSWLYSSFGNNFVKTMLKLSKEKEKLSVIYDQVGTPTYARDLAQVILKMVESSICGLYHYSNEGVSSWYDFAKEIISFRNLLCAVDPIETKDYPTPAIRPFYSVLNKSKIKTALNLKIPHWRDSLQECLRHMQNESI